MANKRIRTSPRYLELVGVVGGTSYTITGDGIVVPDSVAVALTGIADAAGVTTVVGDTAAPISPVTAYPGTTRSTGWRDISKVINGTIDAHAIIARRVGRRVTVLIDPENNGGVHGDQLGGFLLPAGFWPSVGFTGNAPVGIVLGDDGSYDDTGILGLTADGTFQAAGIASGNEGYVGMGRFEYDTDDAWPDTLPGVQITPPTVIDDHNNTAVGIADTGWRNCPVIHDSAAGKPVVGDVHLRRVGNQVEIAAGTTGLADLVANGQYNVVAPGFLPGGSEIINLLGVKFDDTVGAVNAVRNDTPGVLTFATARAGLSAVKGSWRTDDPWPTVLPGTEVTPAAVVPVQPVAAGVETRKTGWRDVTDLFDNSLADGTVTINRTGDIVELSFDPRLVGETVGSINANALPAGFKTSRIGTIGGGAVYARVGGFAFADDLTRGSEVVVQEASVSVNGGGGSGSVYLSWVTTDPWPSSLPGTAVPQ